MRRLKRIPGRSWAVGVTIFFMAGLSVIAFVESFYAMSNLTVLLGGSANMAWGFPTFIDGAMVAAMISIFVLRGQKGIGMARTLFIGSAAASIFGNVAHTVLVFDPAKGGLLWLAITWFVLPPVFLLILTEVLVLMTARRPVAEEPEAVAVIARGPVAHHDEPAAAAIVTAPAPVAAPLSSLSDTVVATVDEPVDNVIATDSVPVEGGPGEVALQGAVAASDTVDDTVDAEDDSVIDTDDEPVEAAVEEVPEAATPAEPVAPVRRLHAVEQAPETPDEQIEWILAKARTGADVSVWQTLAQMFADAGIEMSDRTVQRRLAAAKQRDPELFGLAS